MALTEADIEYQGLEKAELQISWRLMPKYHEKSRIEIIKKQ